MRIRKFPLSYSPPPRHSPLDLERALLCLGEDVGVADDPEEGEESEAAGEDRAVELDTPEAGGERRAPQQDRHSLRPGQATRAGQITVSRHLRYCNTSNNK